MLLKYLAMTSASLLLVTRPTLAGDTGCFEKSEKFTDVNRNGDITKAVTDFCAKFKGSQIYGSRVGQTRFDMMHGIREGS